MRRMNLKCMNSSWGNLGRMAVVLTLAAGCFTASCSAQEKGQKTYGSAEEASQSLVAALRTNDENTILEVLGKDAKQLVASGDEAEDQENRNNFVRSFEEMHRLVAEPDGTTTLYIGAKNWPTPIPIVANKSGRWYFDTDAAKKEILFRRIGRNEISTMHVLRELVAAQKEYYSMQNSVYAQKIRSDSGKPNGLYWETSGSGPKSPIGPLVASAVGEEYAKSQGDAPTPYRGYYFRTLTGQGKDAPGGAKSYLLNGKMTEGFAFVAYPAMYRSSGVVTFIVGPDGAIYEKDLGKKTEALTKAMKEFNPDPSWHKAEEIEEMASEQSSK